MQGSTHGLLPDVVAQFESAAGCNRLVHQIYLGGDGRSADRLGNEANGPDPTKPVGRQGGGKSGVVLVDGPAYPVSYTHLTLPTKA